MKLALLVPALLLAGCATTSYVPTPPEAKVKAQANVVKLCDPVPAAPPRGSNFGTVMDAYDDLVGVYEVCATRDATKLQFIRSQGH